MKNLKLKYYRWRAASAKKAMKNMVYNDATAPASRRYERLERSHGAAAIRVAYLSTDNFGLDITGKKIDKHDVSFDKATDIPGDYRRMHPDDQKHRDRAIRVGEDKSTKVTYKRDDNGDIWEYHNGERVGTQPAKGLGIKD